MKNIIKISLLFVLGTLVFSLFGTSFTLLFDNFNSVILYVSTGSIGLVFMEILSFLGWLLDLLFFDSAIGGYTLTMAPSITVGSISWVLSLFRLLFGLSMFVLLLSLIFGYGGE